MYFDRDIFRKHMGKKNLIFTCSREVSALSNFFSFETQLSCAVALHMKKSKIHFPPLYFVDKGQYNNKKYCCYSKIYRLLFTESFFFFFKDYKYDNQILQELLNFDSNMTLKINSGHWFECNTVGRTCLGEQAQERTGL